MSKLAVASLIVLIACEGSPENAGQLGSPGAGEHDLGEQLALVRVDSLPNKWSPAAGWVINRVHLLGDVNADGVTDVAVDVTSTTGQGSQVLMVAGPLREAKTLPGDEFAVIEGAGVDSVGDATGDGVIDIDLVMADRTDLTLVPGPFEGTVDANANGIRHAYGLMDLNGDGVLDQYTTGSGTDGRVELTWGPAARWATEPVDVIVAPECGDLGRDDWNFGWPQAWPDVTGDMVRELWIAGFGNFSPCSNYLLPLPSTGTVDPETDVNAVSGVAPFELVPDQTGDGAPDLYLASTGEVLSTPVTFRDGEIESAVGINVDLTLQSLYAQDFDLNADGIGDFIGIDVDIDPSHMTGDVEAAPMATVTGTYLVKVNGGASLSAPTYDIAWDMLGGGPAAKGEGIVEGGVGAVLISWDGNVTIVDLGAATPTP